MTAQEIIYTKQFIQNAINEDIGDGDHTSLACIPATAIGKAKLLVKQKGVFAGIEFAKMVFEAISPNIEFVAKISDGSNIQPNDIAFIVEGETQKILQAERLALNILQRMSGIATETKRYVDLLAGLQTKILDTRKTTPGFRIFEKMAVKIGGGENHRMGLFDMIMLKDNHIDFAGGIPQAIEAVNKYLLENNKKLKIEIEARNFNEIEQILRTGKIHRIMLDNFSIDNTKKAVEIIGKRYEIESSGGITFQTIRKYAECGVDYISVGALTHQIKSLDLSLKAF